MSDILRLDYVKSTHMFHVYKNRDPDSFTNTIYLRKTKVKGRKPPAFISLIHFQSEETTDVIDLNHPRPAPTDGVR